MIGIALDQLETRPVTRVDEYTLQYTPSAVHLASTGIISSVRAEQGDSDCGM